MSVALCPASSAANVSSLAVYEIAPSSLTSTVPFVPLLAPNVSAAAELADSAASSKEISRPTLAWALAAASPTASSAVADARSEAAVAASDFRSIARSNAVSYSV